MDGKSGHEKDFRLNSLKPYKCVVCAEKMYDGEDHIISSHGGFDVRARGEQVGDYGPSAALEYYADALARVLSADGGTLDLNDVAAAASEERETIMPHVIGWLDGMFTRAAQKAAAAEPRNNVGNMFRGPSAFDLDGPMSDGIVCLLAVIIVVVGFMFATWLGNYLMG